MFICITIKLTKNQNIQKCTFYFQQKTFIFEKNFNSKNIVKIFQRFRDENVVIKNHEKI